jgi:hypothetical protein
LFIPAFATGSLPDGNRKRSLIAIRLFDVPASKFRPLASPGTP